jgi:hypothetical protein
MLDYIKSDGRRPAGITPGYGDCAARAITIACNFTYRSVAAHLLARAHRRDFTDGYPHKNARAALEARGWCWHWAPQQHPRIPLGRATAIPPCAVAFVEWERTGAGPVGHYTAIVDGIIFDVFDPRSGRLVGFFTPPDRTASPRRHPRRLER